MGRLKLGRIAIDYKYLYIAAGLAGAVILGLFVWFVNQERLPGYNTDPTLKLSYVEPGGETSEYITGLITMLEISIKGPKMTVKMDVNQSDRTFYVPSDAPVWLGLTIGAKDITGRERIAFTDLKKGWRVAAFIGPQNKARRLNVLKRVNSEQ
ncbi:MAG: hypothetical protein WC891_06500 [Actinomycetota bacterium]